MTNVGARKPPDHGPVVATVVHTVEAKSRPYLLASVLRIEGGKFPEPFGSRMRGKTVHVLSYGDNQLWPLERAGTFTFESPVTKTIDQAKLTDLLQRATPRRPRRIEADRLAPDEP